MWGKLRLLPAFAILTNLLAITEVKAYQVGNNKFRRAEPLDPEGKYLLEWEVDWTTNRIRFNLTVETQNCVGFGLSENGLQTGADFVVGGVDRNGRVYFSDRHIPVGGGDSLLDQQQDYKIHSGWERGTHTFLSFSRKLDTCDPEDYPITSNRISILWAYGTSDNENGVSFQNQGVYNIYLLDPDYAPEILRLPGSAEPLLITEGRNEHIPKDTSTWSISRSTPIPSNETSYICSIHKVPRIRGKRHVVGIDIHFPDEISRKSTHHLITYRCHAPAGISQDAMFEHHLSNPGEPCYLQFRSMPEKGRTLPLELCSEVYMGWATGAKGYFTPNHVGYEFEEDDYILLQAHYDNPRRESGLTINARLDFFHTDKLREYDGGMFGIINNLPGFPESLLVPKHSRQHKFFSHCSTACTEKMLPESGFNITSVILHSHNAGVGMRLHHFRQGRELPFIEFDDNYSNQFQPIRHLREEVKVLPGDQLTVECSYSTNETTAVGGFATKQEMCVAFIVHYTRLKNYSVCESGINSPMLRQEFLGVQNVSWVEDELEWVVNSPPKLAGFTISEVSDNFVDWTPAKRRSLEHYHKVLPHWGGCYADLYTRDLSSGGMQWPPYGEPLPGPLDTPTDHIGPVSYPLWITPYEIPPRYCPNSRF